jgi:Sirohaem synthase dimerisation region
MNGCSLRLLAEVWSHARTSCANPLALGDWDRTGVCGVELDTIDAEHDPLLLEHPSARNRLVDDAVVEYFSRGDVLRPAPSWRELRRHIPDIAMRRRVLEDIFAGRVADLVFANRDNEAAALFADKLGNSGPASRSGMVYLVGSGPGAADLLARAAPARRG